jgi:pimeloyl-ACP methyl ester carboxylesterase
MKSLFLFIACSFTFALFSQFQVGHTTITFNDPARTGGTGSGGGPGRQIQTEIYYPAATAGDNVALASGQFPVITFGHGFAMSWDAYANIWQHYVAKGYILAFPRTEGSLIPAPSHGDFAMDLQQVTDKTLALNTDVNSIFNGKILQKSAIIGHSMGGGAAILVASNTLNTSHIQTVVGLAPAETNPSAITVAPNVGVPTLIFSGTADGVTPPADHHIPIYQGLNSICKAYISITGGAHCYFANTNFNCDFGESTTSTNISITREEQQTATFNILDPWLDFKLKGICQSYQLFFQAMQSTNGTVNQSIGLEIPPTIVIQNNPNQGTGVYCSSLLGGSYQWYMNGQPIPDETQLCYNIPMDLGVTYQVEVSGYCFCALSQSFTFTSGTNELISEELNIYPNPTKDFLNIKNNFGLETSYKLIDIDGRILMDVKSISTEFLLDLRKFENGNYLLQVENFNGRKTIKVVKD